MNYTTQINKKDITEVQIKRVEFTQEVNFITAYNLGFNKIDFTLPFEQRNILFDVTPINQVDVFDDKGFHVFSGYITAKKEETSSRIVYMTATAYLNQLSKKLFTLSDTGYESARAYMFNLFINQYLPSLPVEYLLNPHVINDSLINGISIYKNTGTGTENGISGINTLSDILDTAVYAENGVLTFCAFPENWPLPQNVFDITLNIDKPLVIQEKIEFYYDTVTLEYLNVPNGTKKTLTKGNGGLLKKIAPSNIFLDDQSAQRLIERKFNILSKVYSFVEFNCDSQANIKLTDYFTYEGYVFLITYLQNAYTHYKVKAIGIKIKGASQ